MTPITKSAALLIVLSATLIGCADKSLLSPDLSQAQNTTPQATTSTAATPTPKSTVKPIPTPQSTPVPSAIATPKPTTAPEPTATPKPAVVGNYSKTKSVTGDRVPYSWYYMKKKRASS
jgi:peptidoglycan-N-acetylmuramic acid deacetylase